MKRNKDFYRIKEDRHRFYYASGIPFRYWNQKPGKPEFQTIWWHKTKINKDLQLKWFNSILSGELYSKPLLAVFSSQPSDETALAQAYQLCKRMVWSKKAAPLMKIAISAIDGNNQQQEDRQSESSDVYMLHNVLSRPNRERRVAVRDWITRHNDTFRIVVVAGHPYDFCRYYGVDPDIILFFDHITKFVSTFA